MVLNDFLYSIDPNTMLLGLLFIIFFVFVQFALSKTLRDKKTAGIIAFCVSLLAVYGINRTNLDISGIFSNIGITEEIIYSVVPFIILAGLVYMIWKLKLPLTLMLVGALLVILSFFAYEQTILLIVGAALILIGLFLWFRAKKKGTSQTSSAQNNTNGRDALISAAKKFHDWARRQSNPRFVGSWAKFVHWLGGDEAKICQTYGVSQSDFVSIFNRYGKV